MCIKRGKVDEYISVSPRNQDRQVGEAAVLNRRMKLLVLAIAVALLFTAVFTVQEHSLSRRVRHFLQKIVEYRSEALDCHRCVSKQAGGECELTVETCKPGKDACAAAMFLRAPHGQYQKCMALTDCEDLKMNAFINMKCCTQDMCNTFDN